MEEKRVKGTIKGLDFVKRSNKMKEPLELRLVNFAQKVANMYQDRISQEQYQQLCNAINVCRDYYIKRQSNWTVMYEVVLGEDGIWEDSDFPDLEEEVKDMWALVTDILLCNCSLGCVAEPYCPPQDMEIQEDNIPEFVNLLESMIKEKIDYESIFEFWAEEMCY